MAATAWAQPRFSAKAIAAVTAAQVDGDQSAGFHKVGLQGGLGVTTRLQGKQAASIEILYTQRGCRNQPGYEFATDIFNTTLNYIEIPVQWHYGDWLVEGKNGKSDYYRVTFNTGLIYSRLFSYKDKYGGGIESALPDLKQNGLVYALGASIYMNRHLGWTFRYQTAITRSYIPGENTNYFRSLRERYLVFQLNYRI